MGKLKSQNIIIAIVLALGLFTLIRPKIVEASTADAKVRQFLTAEILDIKVVKDDNGYSQIAYTFNEKTTFITQGNTTHASPMAKGNYVTYMAEENGKWQIYLHHIPTFNTVRISTQGNSVNPNIYDNLVTWEQQIKDTWQIMLFDGGKIIQLTDSAEPNQDVSINEGMVVYVRKNSKTSKWNVTMYDIRTETTTVITKEEHGRKPTIENGYIQWHTLEDTVEIVKEYNIESGNIARAFSNKEKIKFDHKAFKDYLNQKVTKDAIREELYSSPN